ncbi:MAG: SH3 domain-containing protein [Acidobacteriota bacterium]
MKRCPSCNTTYTDQSLRYCLTDGTTLEAIEQETFVRSAGTNPLRVDIQTANSAPIISRQAPEKKGGFPIVKVLIGVIILGIIGLGALGLIGGIFYFSTSGTVSNQNTKPAPPTPLPSPTVDPEKQRLQDQLANAQKQLDEQKNANRAANLTPAFPTPEKKGEPGVVTARVNSPGDGFLAMRSEPSADYGERVYKIPNGAVVNIQNCQRDRVRIGDRTGRWCMVTYSDHVGWVFDAWLDY